MKNRLYTLLLCLLLSYTVTAQQPSVNDYIASYAQTAPAAEQSFRHFISFIQKHKSKDDRVLLHDIFKQAHRRILKNYQAHAEFPALLTSGDFDCLTATAFLSLALTEFNFRYTLIETNYHIFILVHATTGDVLLETTDRWNGFIADPQKIKERISTYQQNLVAALDPNEKKIYHYQVNLYCEVLPEQLRGLLYFNQAVNCFNKQEWQRCAELLDNAKNFYDSPRIKELAAILLQTVRLKESDNAKKAKVISQLRKHLAEKSLAGI